MTENFANLMKDTKAWVHYIHTQVHHSETAGHPRKRDLKSSQEQDKVLQGNENYTDR